ncbi:hypothetical protein PIROE2DRAFT_3320 [Piromyces sp. E2]|nr:hypothetical protein PIROE2DRAFT_3320 [Piromyces sp. E2]|eukprot:OUM68930.1 hypothetical protein PIROE2DRAFT_3320 [Piromyces sp. E2]
MEEKLSGADNFDIWYSTIIDYLETKNLRRYVDLDIINLLERDENESKERLKIIRNTEREDALVRTSNMDKLSLMYDAIPNELKSKVNFTSRLNYKEFYEKIKDKHSIMIFNRDRKFYKKPHSQVIENQNKNNNAPQTD